MAARCWFIALLLISLQNIVFCGKTRNRCRSGLKMERGQCVKPWSNAFVFSPRLAKGLDTFTLHLRSKLKTNISVPCQYWESGGVRKAYCEACFPDDPARVFCPTEKMDGKLWNRTELMEEYFKLSVYSDLSEWQCSSFSKSGGAVSYYSGYDDGTICDCGSPFILHVGVMPPVKWTDELKWTDVMSFRPLNGISPGEWIGNEMIYVKESTGAPAWYSAGEAPWREFLTDSEKSRPADVPPKSSCGQRPDISSLFKINYIYEAGHFNDADTEYVPVQVGSGGCLIDNTFLEHLPIIDNEVREKEAGDPSWCVAKCNANPECAAWTLSKLNGWCTLKTVKGLTTSTFLELKNFMSGLKDCKFKN